MSPRQPRFRSSPSTRRRVGAAAVVAIGVAAAVAIVLVALTRVRADRAGAPATPSAEPGPPPDSHFVGSQACAGCHATQHAAWSTSHHRHAMEPADARSVRGDFDGATFRYFGRETRFSRSGGAFQVTTENQQGRTETFTVAYTLGYAPLQQYLVAFPDGRLQALPFAWDTRPRAQGGERWFHLYPDTDVGPADPLFWTRPRQNWNHMCGDCHTTAFSKRFSAAAGKPESGLDGLGRFDSRWSEVGNGCESCHGAGSAHVAATEQRGDAAAGKPATPTLAARALVNGLHSQAEQLDQCGVCHARRVRLREDPSRERMHDTWRPELLGDGLYFVDGQIKDEVFEIGSFLQSKMAARGVTCSQCHDPHTAKLRAEGNALCTQCHDRQTFDSGQHHFHRAGTDGARCVSCHMPSRTYMVVHARRDHRIAVPRPDLATALGTPDACSACHADRGPAWAAAAIRSHATGRRQGPSAAEALGPALTRVRGEEHDAAAALGALLADPAAAGIAKATALASVAPSEALALAPPHLRAADPWLRLGAVQALAGAPLTARVSAVAPLAADPARAVRLAAAPLLAGADRTAMGPDERRDVDAVFAEHRAWLAANGDRAEAVVAQAGVHRAEGDGAAAQAAFERALRLDDTSIVAYLNFADHLRGAGDDATAEALLRKACALYPESADAHHALGLALVRRKQAEQGVRQLARAAELAPGNSHYAYAYGVGLYSTRQLERALATLSDARARFPDNRQIQATLRALCADRGAGAGCP